MIKRLTPRDPVSKWVICLLNGVDVTDGCFFADERGVVGHYLKNSSGRRYEVNGRPAREFRRGRVKIVLEYGAPQDAQKRFQELQVT
jgi:hypothetical protein